MLSARGLCDHQPMARTVLIVDDHATLPGDGRGPVQLEGFEVVSKAADAHSAPDAVRRLQPSTFLERLGDPANIAAKARERFGVQAEPARRATPMAGGHRAPAVVIPLLGSVVGVVLVWVSRPWTTSDKLIGTSAG
jgi:DNA-binding NarL/FixJ family response regulator